MPTKACGACGQTKSLDDFNRRLGGHQAACRECDRKRASEWYQNNKERAAASRRAYEAANREKINERARAWRARTGFKEAPRDPDAVRDYKLNHTYGISLAEYRAMLEAQGGLCAICGTDNPRGRGQFHVDHDHETGALRGLLCHNCNVGLGNFKDNPEMLRAALTYLT